MVEFKINMTERKSEKTPAEQLPDQTEVSIGGHRTWIGRIVEQPVKGTDTPSPPEKDSGGQTPSQSK